MGAYKVELSYVTPRNLYLMIRCVIDGIISQLFYFIINNKTRRIIDFVNSDKELRNKIWKKFE